MFDMRIDYPPNFQTRWNKNGKLPGYIMSMLQAHEKTHTQFIEMLSKYEEDFMDIPVLTDDENMPRWRQPWFLPLDGMSTYGIVADRKPQCVIEVGSGNSTKFIAHAKRNHNPTMELHSIDPRPRAEINTLCDHVYRYGLEDIDLSIFETLEKGDMVFFDGSHRALQNSDVTVFFMEVLPRLADGVIVGIHDIFLPLDYYPEWERRYYSEQYMLGAYMIPYRDKFPLVAACHYLHKFMGEELRAAFSPEFIALLPEKIQQRVPARINGSAFWFETGSL